jgi:hypothetical protein
MSIAHAHMPHRAATGSAALSARDHLPAAYMSDRMADRHPLAAVDGETPKDLLWLGRLLCLTSSAVTLALVAVAFI